MRDNDQGSHQENVYSSETEYDAEEENDLRPIRRPVIIIQLDVEEVGDIEAFLADILKKTKSLVATKTRTKIIERLVGTPMVNYPFKMRTWEWSSQTPDVNYKKYYPERQKIATKFHLVACYYTDVSERPVAFLVSNNVASLQRFVKFANSAFPLLITRRLIDGNSVAKYSSHHLTGNVFTNTRVLRNKMPVDFSDVPVLLLSFTASIREHASILRFSPFNISTRDHNASIVSNVSFKFNTPLSRDEEIIILNHLYKIIQNQPTNQWNSNTQTSGIEENDVDLPLDVATVNKSVDIELNHEMAISIYHNIIQNTKLDLSIHFAVCFVSESEIKFGSESLSQFHGIPTLAEILKTISSSGKLGNKKSLMPEQLWKFFKKFRIHTLAYGDPLKKKYKSPSLQSFSIVDIMHGAIHYEDKTYWRFCSKWYQVSSDRLAILEYKFRQLLQKNLMSHQDPGYLGKKFPRPTLQSNQIGSSNDAASASTSQDSPASTSSSGLDSNKPIVRDNLEHDYNCSFKLELDFLVGDKIVVNSIELFDLLRYESGKLWIYHVKRKFGQSTRDATSQLAISAKLIQDDLIGTGEKTLNKQYDKLLELHDNKSKLISWGINNDVEYVNMFRKSSLTFVYAFVDEDNKSENRTLRKESHSKTVVTVADIKKKLEEYKGKIDKTNFNQLIQELYRIVFELEMPDFDPENLQILANDLFQFLVKAKLVGSDGKVTGKLLFGINLNQLGGISSSVQKFHDFSLKFSVKINFFEFILKSYRSMYQTLIAKIELHQIYRFISEKGYQFQICEIEQADNNNPITPSGVSGNSSSNKRKNASGSSKKKSTKKDIPKGQPFINQKFKVVSRNLFQSQ